MLKSLPPFTSVVLFLLLCTASALPPSAKPVSGNVQGQAPAPEGFGPYLVGWMNLNIPVTGSETLLIAIYYPSVAAGGGSDPNMTDAPYPAVLFSPGYMTSIDSYRNFASVVASWGFVFTLIGSDPEAWDSERAADVIHALDWLDAQNDNSSFKLAETVNESAFGIAGHSLGSEAVVKVARSDSRLKALVSIAPFTVSPGSTAAVTVPLLILAASADTVTPPNDMAYPLYQNGNIPKFCITMVGETHLGIIFSCPKYVVSFLKFYLYEDWDYATFLCGNAARQEADTGRIVLAYDLRVTVEYEAVLKGVPYRVNVYSDSEFQGFCYDEVLNEMNFSLAGPPSTFGTAHISVPRPIAENYSFEVYFDSEPSPHSLTSNLTHYSIYLSYNHSVHWLVINMVDIVPPSVSIVSPSGNSVINSSNVTVAWIGTDAASGLNHFEVRIDEGAWLDVGSATVHEFVDIDDGNHVVWVKAFDEVGNANETFVNFTVLTGSDTPSPLTNTWFLAALAAITASVIFAALFLKRRHHSSDKRS